MNLSWFWREFLRLQPDPPHGVVARMALLEAAEAKRVKLLDLKRAGKKSNWKNKAKRKNEEEATESEGERWKKMMKKYLENLRSVLLCVVLLLLFNGSF